DYYYDVQQHDFPWRNTWFAATFMHIWLKNLIIAAGLPVLIFAYSTPSARKPGYRRCAARNYASWR
ncbi:MAG TPA: hypothetical protein VD885_02000, partial [Methylophilaceae bacterium]|nr:hypothetical protein [Methylophilaceae bacterium]